MSSLVTAAISAQRDVVSNARDIRNDLILQLFASARSNGQNIREDVHVAQDVDMVC